MSSVKGYAKLNSRKIDNAIYGIAYGEEGALRDLYDMTDAAIYAYALTFTKNVYDAQDVMQDTYIKVYDAAPSYVSQGKPMSWIMRIVKNLCYDKLRQNERNVNADDSILERQLFATDADVTDKLVVLGCLQTLDSDECKIIVMHAVGGIKHREIAAELDIPLNTVLSKYRRALKKMQYVLEGGQS